MGGKRYDPNHGCHLWPVPGGVGYGHDGHGGVLPLCCQCLHSGSVHGLGTAVPGCGVAAFSGFWRTAHRGGESTASAGAGRDLRRPDHLCETHFQPAAEYCPRTLHCPDGHIYDTKQLYVRWYPAGSEQRADNYRIRCYCRGPDPADYLNDRSGLELLQAPPGDGGAVCAGGRPLLYLTAGLCHGRIQGDIPRFSVLVPDGRLPVIAAGP